MDHRYISCIYFFFCFQVARFGRGFDNSPTKDYGPIKVKSPFDFQPNALQRTSTKFKEDNAPVFDLQEMLREQELKRRIEEANRREEEKLKQQELVKNYQVFRWPHSDLSI